MAWTWSTERCFTLSLTSSYLDGFWVFLHLFFYCLPPTHILIHLSIQWEIRLIQRVRFGVGGSDKRSELQEATKCKTQYFSVQSQSEVSISKIFKNQVSWESIHHRLCQYPAFASRAPMLSAVQQNGCALFFSVILNDEGHTSLREVNILTILNNPYSGCLMLCLYLTVLHSYWSSLYLTI